MRSWSAAVLVVVLGCASFGATTAAAAPSRGQSSDEIVAARKLFAEGLKDEEAKNYEVALEKYKRVQAVKDTAQVRYRIASSLEGLGKWRQAQQAYDGAAEMAAKEPKEGELARAARERSADLQRRMPQLTLTLSSKTPPGAEIEIDHQKVSESALREPLPLDPGPHDVNATAPGVPAFHTAITMNEGARLSIVVPLDPAAPPPLPPPGPGSGSDGTTGEGASPQPGLSGGSSPPPSSTPLRASARATVGWIGVGTGAALVVASGVVLLMRHNDIATLKRECPTGVCRADQRTELTSTRNHAVTEGTVSAVLGIGGVLVAGAGAYLLLTIPRASSASSPPPQGRARVGVTGYPLVGGGAVLVSGAY